MRIVGFNINDTLLLKLTDVGRLQYAKHYVAFEMSPPPLKLREDGSAAFVVWEAMRIFGPALSMGGPLMFETSVWLEQS